MKLNSRGFNLISVVTALAVLSILTAVVTTLYRNIVELSLQAEATHDIDSLMHTVQDIFNSNLLCHRSLRTAGGGLISWDGVGNPFVPSIQSNNGQTPPVVVAAMGQPIGPRIRIREIRIRPPNPAAPFFEGQPSTSTFFQGTVQYTVNTAKVEFWFEPTPQFASVNIPPGVFKKRTANITVARLGNVIQFCFQQANSGTIAQTCNSATPGYGLGCTPVAGSCQPVYFLAGFDAAGGAICDCRLSCTTPTTPLPPGGGKGSPTAVLSGVLGGAAGTGVGATGGFGAAAGGVGAVGTFGGVGGSSAFPGGATGGAVGSSGMNPSAGPYGAGPSLPAGPGAGPAAGTVFSN